MADDNRPSGTDYRYRFVGLKAFDRYTDKQERIRHRDLNTLRKIVKRLADVEEVIQSITVTVKVTSEEE